MWYRLIRLLERSEAPEEVPDQSKNTRHCWIIQKRSSLTNHKPVILYHKHHLSDPYYHKQYATLTVKHAIQISKEHDAYILAQRQRQSACKS